MSRPNVRKYNAKYSKKDENKIKTFYVISMRLQENLSIREFTEAMNLYYNEEFHQTKVTRFLYKWIGQDPFGNRIDKEAISERQLELFLNQKRELKNSAIDKRFVIEDEEDIEESNAEVVSFPPISVSGELSEQEKAEIEMTAKELYRTILQISKQKIYDYKTFYNFIVESYQKKMLEYIKTDSDGKQYVDVSNMSTAFLRDIRHTLSSTIAAPHHNIIFEAFLKNLNTMKITLGLEDSKKQFNGDIQDILNGIVDGEIERKLEEMKDYKDDDENDE